MAILKKVIVGSISYDNMVGIGFQSLSTGIKTTISPTPPNQLLAEDINLEDVIDINDAYAYEEV